MELCESKNLFITNSAFAHPSRHITTWTGHRQDPTTGNTVPIYNQIDYIICQRRYKHLSTNARSYGGTILSSDHKIVITTFELDWCKVWRNTKHTTNSRNKTNIANVVNSRDCRNKYQQLLDTRLSEINLDNNTPNETWQMVRRAIVDTAQETLGEIKRTRPNRTPDESISKLSTQQKQLRIKIDNTRDKQQKLKLKKERNETLHQIRKRVQDLRNAELDKKADSIANAKSDDAMFSAVKALNPKTFENPQVEDNEGKIITNPNEILKTVANHFESKFKDGSKKDIPPFQGTPRALHNPVSKDEVRKSFNRLKNNKASGEDQIASELLKYAPPILDQTIADIINNTFETHEVLDINTGVLIAIQKPGKAKGPPNNLRPITLLNTIRKTLSLITLDRIRPAVEQYLAHSQSGFRPDRSTSDVVWTHRWLAAKTSIEDITIKVTGIDMSAAFDTINREVLLNILAKIVKEDELRLIQFLLSNTRINTRINKADIEAPFTSNVGTPQGDGLSPVLFTIYLEHALKSARNTIGEPTTPIDKIIPREIAYADDVDFIGSEHINIDKIQKELEKFNFKVNVDKTELTSLRKEENEWRETKKVGSLIGDAEDVERRKKLSNVALNKLRAVWISNDKIKRNIKIKLYSALVKSILTYNCGTWALTQAEATKLDAFHRKQLRQVLNIRYPTKITNKSLYRICNEKPLSTHIVESRWRLFGHILRRDRDIPANKAMQAYFHQMTCRHRGRPTTTLPVIINKELSKTFPHMKLKTSDDLQTIRLLAQDRNKWITFARRITKFAEATDSDEPDANSG